MRICRAATVLITLVLSGCAAASQASPPGPGTSGGPDPTAAATAAPTAAPSVTVWVTGSPTPAPSCPAGPLSVGQFLAADPRCYLSGEVAVAGWWGERRTDEPGEGTRLDWAVRGSMPFGSASADREDLVLVDEIAVVRQAGWPDGIHWATVTGVGSPAGDLRACHRDRGSDVMAAPHCPRYLVASSVVESEAPASALAACSTLTFGETGRVAVESFTGYPPACFGSKDVTVQGWLDIRYIITGWEDPWAITPDWLWLPIGPWTVVAPGSNPEVASALYVYADPARGVDVRRTNRWVLLTGHYADPKAQTCRVVYSPGVTPEAGNRIPDAYARRLCEAHFVVTSIRDTNP